MEFHIRELPDGKATLMTSDGLHLFTFRNLQILIGVRVKTPEPPGQVSPACSLPSVRAFVE